MELAVIITMIGSALWLAMWGFICVTENIRSFVLLRLLPIVIAGIQVFTATGIISSLSLIRGLMWTTGVILLYLGLCITVKNKAITMVMFYKMMPFGAGLAQIICVLKFY